MSVKKSNLLIFVGMISVFCSCKKDVGGDGIPASGFKFPMEVGYKWVYQVSVKEGKRVRTSYACHWEIVRGDTIQGKNVKVLRQIANWNKQRNDTSYEYLYEDSTGLYVLATEGGLRPMYFKTEQPVAGFFPVLGKADNKSYTSPSWQLLKYPMSTNASWNSNEFDSPTRIRENAGVENVSIPSGTFTANKVVIPIQIPGDSYLISQYYTSQKGLLRETFSFPLITENKDTLVSDVVLLYTNF